MKTSDSNSTSLVRAKSIDGPPIHNIDEWLSLAGPKKPLIQWKDFCSAKELARAWLRNGSPSMPVEYKELLRSSKETRKFEASVAYAEVAIAIDEFGGPRNSDMVVIGEAGRNRVCLAVEAKGYESFAEVIRDELTGLSDTSKKPERVGRLVSAVLQRKLDAHVMTLRYQLLHSLAATAIEARKQDAELGVLLIHEFISLTSDFDQVTRNAADLKAFVQTVPDWKEESVVTGKLLPSITLKGNDHIPSDQLVTIGKVRTLIPLDAQGRERQQAGFDSKRRQFLVASPSTTS